MKIRKHEKVTKFSLLDFHYVGLFNNNGYHSNSVELQQNACTKAYKNLHSKTKWNTLPFLLYSERLQHSCGPLTANCGHQCKIVRWVPSLEGCDHQMDNWQPAVGTSSHRMNAPNTCSITSIAMRIFYTMSTLIKLHLELNSFLTLINHICNVFTKNNCTKFLCCTMHCAMKTEWMCRSKFS
jgi:hypothetical protein